MCMKSKRCSLGSRLCPLALGSSRTRILYTLVDKEDYILARGAHVSFFCRRVRAIPPYSTRLYVIQVATRLLHFSAPLDDHCFDDRRIL